MENSLLIGLSRQQVLGRQLNVIANNLANMRTSGFKAGSLVFEEFIMPDAAVTDARLRDRELSYVIDRGMRRDYQPGEFQRTGAELDVAIGGQGWLVVQTPEGERYTRDGGLKIDNNGQLVTGAGFPVLGTGGPIQFDARETGIAIATDGTVSTAEGEKGRLRVVRFPDEGKLVQQDNNLFNSPDPAEPAVNVRILQGVLEGSNVKPVVETALMIEVTRAYTNLSQMMERMQEQRRESINELASVPA